MTPARHALGVAAAGLALFDAASAQARPRPIEGMRAAQSPMLESSGDTYQDGRARLAEGDFAGAIAAFRTTLLVSPQSIDALNGLGVAYDRIGRYDISRSYYDTALAIDPGAVLVLNNLGYSLYLQGAYQEAIPLLQQVVGSDDVAAQRAGQRVLTLIAARMRADAIEGRVVVATAAPAARPTIEASAVHVEAPQARIEITASGEQRLVIGAPAPDAALAARLGDAATLVLVAKDWTPRDEAMLAARETAADRAADKAARTAIAEQLALALAAARPQPAAHADLPADAMRVTLVASKRRRTPNAPPVGRERAVYLAPQTAMALTSAISARITAMADRVDEAMDLAARRAADSGRLQKTPRIDHSVQTAAAGIGADVASDNGTPAWLLASRRAPRLEEPTVVADNGMEGGSVAKFESDDEALNVFAARMRGIEAAPPNGPVPVEEAVARLEGLLRRLRRA